MKRFSIFAAAAALAISVAGTPGVFAANAQGPHVLVIDRHAIMTQSRLGENIRQQIMAYEDKAQNDLGPEGQSLQSQMQALDQSTSLPADVRAKKSQALQTKEAAYRQKAQDRQSLIQGGEMVVRARYLTEVGAIVHAIMMERGADAVLEKSTVVDSVNGLDITHEVIQRLDRKITSLKVPLVKPPLSNSLQMQH